MAQAKEEPKIKIIDGYLCYKRKILNKTTWRLNTILICGQENCLKEFNKKCNL